MGTVADGGVGAGVVDGDGERRAAGGLVDPADELGLLGEPGGDEEVEQQIAARACFANDQVAQQPAVALPRERAQAQLARGLSDRVAGSVHRLRRQQAVGHVDDLPPGPALVQAQDEAALVVLPERELHLVAVAPRVVHAADGLEPVVGEVCDALQRVDNLLLLVLELGGVLQRLPLAPTALPCVAAARSHPARGGGEELERLGLRVRRAALDDACQHAVAGHGAADEDDELIQARDALPAVGERGDVELDGLSGAWWHGRPVYLPAGGAANRLRRRRTPAGARRPGASQVLSGLSSTSSSIVHPFDAGWGCRPGRPLVESRLSRPAHRRPAKGVLW